MFSYGSVIDCFRLATNQWCYDICDMLYVDALDLSASAKTVGGAFAVAAVWAVVSLIAVYGVFKRRDI